MLLDEKSVTRSKIAGSGIEDIFLEVPHNTHRVKWFARHLTSVAIVNDLVGRYDAVTSDGNFSMDGNVMWFNIGGGAVATPSIGEITNALACNRLHYRVQANAGGATQFYLRVRFYDV